MERGLKKTFQPPNYEQILYQQFGQQNSEDVHHRFS